MADRLIDRIFERLEEKQNEAGLIDIQDAKVAVEVVLKQYNYA